MAGQESQSQVVDRALLLALVDEARAAHERPHAGHTEDVAYISGADLVVISPELFLALMDDRERILKALVKARDALRDCAEGRRAIDWFAALAELP